jgi:hypothetical protein
MAIVLARLSISAFEPSRIFAPKTVWFFICSNSSAVSLPGFIIIASGIPILPISCMGEARRILSASSWEKPSFSARKALYLLILVI